MDNRELFSGRAENYVAGRPVYAPELIDYLYQTIGIRSDSVVADVGSGTGKFAKQLLDKGSFVFCVEPNNDMRRVAQRELAVYSKVRFVDGDSDHTKLDDDSVDFITAAQAFHWFDVVKFKAESKRILRPGGKAILLWNHRKEECGINAESFRVFQKYCPRFHGFSGGIKRDDERIIEYFDGIYERVEFDNTLTFDRETFIDRCLSGSYSLAVGDEKYEEYLRELVGLFEKYAQDGLLEMPNQSVAYLGNV